MLDMDKDDSIGFRVPAALKRALEARAEAEHRSLGQLCTLALMAYLEGHGEWPPRTSGGRNATAARRPRAKRARS
jgi:hypothetical protein